MTQNRTLGELLDGLVDPELLKHHRHRVVSGVFDDSRRVRPEGVFVAVRGTQQDGHAFAEAALEKGAIALVGEKLSANGGALVANVPDARSALARMASRWYGLDRTRAGAFQLAGVTGTNGKSTTAFMTRAIVQAAGMKCGLIGTVQYDLCARTVTAHMTTPGALELAAHLRECADAGAAAAVMEVSSHALSQKRTDGLAFATAAFTNLTGDHLDYHRTFEEYRDAKSRLFEGLTDSAVAIINRDDENHAAMVRQCRARLLYYSIDHDADITARITGETVKGTTYVLRIEGQDLALENAVVGRHNVYNAMAAAGMARALGMPIPAIAMGLSSVRNIPGRLQRVPGARGFDVFVDYAHSDDALANVLRVLRGLTKHRLICVFGCGGDRDPFKRPRMGKAASELADCVIVTSDNPRSEDPNKIIEAILAGIDPDKRRRVTLEPDRRHAIRGAVACAGEGDVVLIAGKGHEDYQILGDRKIHFDDIEVAIESLAAIQANP